MNIETGIAKLAPTSYREARYQAHVIVNGRATDITCTHLHHGPGAAARCEPKLARDWHAIFTAPGTHVVAVTEQHATPGLYEVRWGGTAERWTTSKRFRWAVPS